MTNNLSLSKIYFYFLFSLFNIVFLSFMANEYFIVYLSFLSHFFIFFIFLIYHISFERSSLAISSFLIFDYMFFIIAPVIQIMNIQDTGFFPNTYRFDVNEIVIANIILIVFNSLFFLIYIYSSKSVVKEDRIIIENNDEHNLLNITNYKILSFILLLIASIVIFKFQDIIIELFIYRKLEIEISSHVNLILKKTLFFIPFPIVIISWIHRKRSKTFKILFFLAIILLLITKNPFLEKRNALGPIYLTFLYFIFKGIFKNNYRTFGFFIFVFLILFPLSSILTHAIYGLETLLIDPLTILRIQFENETFFARFNHLDFDAYSSLLSTIEYINFNGITFGKQLLGGLLFFIPRTLWPTKPIGSGAEIGNYLMEHYSIGFNNLSSPFVAESIINFGILGIFIYPFLLVYVIRFFNKWFYSNDIFKNITSIYFAFHLIFILRGDFMSSFSYFIGAFTAIYLIPKSLLAIIDKLKDIFQQIQVSNSSIFHIN